MAMLVSGRVRPEIYNLVSIVGPLATLSQNVFQKFLGVDSTWNSKANHLYPFINGWLSIG